MAQKRHTAEQIISKLRQVEVAQAQGATIPQAVKQIGVTEQTFCRWLRQVGVKTLYIAPGSPLGERGYRELQRTTQR